MTESVSHRFLKDIYPCLKGEDHMISEAITYAFLINIFDRRCDEGIKIKAQDIAPELTIWNAVVEARD